MWRVRQNNPTGKSLLIYGNRVKPQNQKYFALSEAKSVAHLGHPVPLRGALAIVTNEGRVAVDAEVRKTRRMTRTAKACGPDVAVLASTHLEAIASQGATEAKEPFSGESTL